MGLRRVFVCMLLFLMNVNSGNIQQTQWVSFCLGTTMDFSIEQVDCISKACPFHGDQESIGEIRDPFLKRCMDELIVQIL